MNDLHDLELLLRSRVPILTIETRDELPVKQLFASLALRMAMPVMAWSATTGLQRIDLDLAPQRHASDPQQALGQIKATPSPTIYLLMDFHPYLDDAYNVRLLKEIALDYHSLGHTLVFVSHALKLPAEIAVLGAAFSLSMPDRAQLESHDSRGGRPLGQRQPGRTGEDRPQDTGPGDRPVTRPDRE